MGIDIFAKWDGMTEAEEAAQIAGCSEVQGHIGYLHEAYQGQPYATVVLAREAFLGCHRVRIQATKLKDRLATTLAVAEQREREVYGVTDDAQIERLRKSYRDFVDLCARKEAETGKPCLIIASY
jgi:hypothetical protein